MRNYFKLSILLGVLLIRPALANDSAGTTAAGGIQFIKSSHIKMVREDLAISPARVKVNYLFQNLSDKDITTQVFFPLPPYKMLGTNLSWDDEVYKSKDAPFRNFSVIVNGKTIAYQVKTQALLNGKDITATLTKAGIPLNTQLAAGQIPMDDEQSAKFKQWYAKAQRLGLLDAKGYPRWQKQVVYYWQQTFPAKQVITISHDYKPAAGEFYGAIWPGATVQTKSVNDVVQRMKLLFKVNLSDLVNGKLFYTWLTQQSTQPKTNGVFAFIYNVDYILTTGANWAGPIQQFSLTLHYPQNSVVAYNHFYDSKPEKVTTMPGKTQIVLHDFTPEQDLHIAFGITTTEQSQYQ